MAIFGPLGSYYERNERNERYDPDYCRVVDQNTQMRRAIRRALEIAKDKKTLNAAEASELRVALQQGLST